MLVSRRDQIQRDISKKLNVYWILSFSGGFLKIAHCVRGRSILTFFHLRILNDLKKYLKFFKIYQAKKLIETQKLILSIKTKFVRITVFEFTELNS